MTTNMPNNETYENIAEWLETYHSTNNEKKKAKTKALIVSHMIPVVKRIARTIARRATDPIEDMIQAGFIGLLKAIDRYNNTRNDNFRIYAGYLIIGEMKHFLRDKLNMIRVPAHIQELSIRINNFTKTLSTEELAALTSDEVAAALNVTPKVVDMALQVERRTTVSLNDAIITHDETFKYEDIISDKNSLASSEYDDIRIQILNALKQLHPEDRLLMELYYKDDLTKAEIARKLDLSLSYVSRKMNKVFALMCTYISEAKQKQEEIWLEEKKNEDDE